MIRFEYELGYHNKEYTLDMNIDNEIVIKSFLEGCFEAMLDDELEVGKKNFFFISLASDLVGTVGSYYYEEYRYDEKWRFDGKRYADYYEIINEVITLYER